MFMGGLRLVVIDPWCIWHINSNDCVSMVRFVRADVDGCVIVASVLKFLPLIVISNALSVVCLKVI